MFSPRAGFCRITKSGNAANVTRPEQFRIIIALEGYRRDGYRKSNPQREVYQPALTLSQLILSVAVLDDQYKADGQGCIVAGGHGPSAHIKEALYGTSCEGSIGVDPKPIVSGDHGQSQYGPK